METDRTSGATSGAAAVEGSGQGGGQTTLMEQIRQHRLWKNINCWDRVFEDRLRTQTNLQHLQDGVGSR